MGQRWYDAIHFKPDEFEGFWKKRFSRTRDLLLITGLGWDPRMTAATNMLKSFGGKGIRDLHLIKYGPSESFVSPYHNFIHKNMELLAKIADGWAGITETQIITRAANNYYVGDEDISTKFVKIDISKYNDIVIDVSALPKSLYFPLLLILIKICIGNENENINVHVIACQDPDFDSLIIESADDTRFLKGFRGGLQMISTQDIPRIWVPLLAKNNTIGLDKLYASEDLNPTDIYPVLPFPSRSPRTDEDLLVEYRHIFVDIWNLNSMNIIYAAEDDPLDVYRRLLTLHSQQKETLKPLGGVKMVVSPLSSKLSSIGAFMAAYEDKMAIAHAIGRHVPPDSMDDSYWEKVHMDRFMSNLHSIWLTGEPYVQ